MSKPADKKKCLRCGEVKPLVTGFHRDRASPAGYSTYCKVCNRERARITRARHKAGLPSKKRTCRVDIVDGRKACTKCGEVKPLHDFRKTTSPLGVSSACKACIRISHRVYYARDKELITKRNQLRRQKNGDAIRAKSRAYRARPEVRGRTNAAARASRKVRIARLEPELVALYANDADRMLRCSKCGEVKPAVQFHKRRSRPTGRSSRCSECRNVVSRAYYAENSERLREYWHKYYREHPDEVRATSKRWRDTHREHINARQNRRRREDLHFRLKEKLRSRFSRALAGRYKHGTTIANLGCSIEQLKAHLEALFAPGMSWENYGIDGWHIDHIKPLARFDLTDPEQVKQACHYTNLQPLWAFDNISKGTKWEEEEAVA